MNIKNLILEKLYILKINLKMFFLLKKIEKDNISIDNVADELSFIDSPSRKAIISYFENIDSRISEVLKLANNIMEEKRISEFSLSVKNNTYKEYLENLNIMQIGDLKESISEKTKLLYIEDSQKHEEYEEYLELLTELETKTLGIEIIDFDSTIELFRNLSIEEIASYIYTYPYAFLLIDLKDEEILRKIEDALELIQNNPKSIEKTDKKLIFKQRKYF